MSRDSELPALVVEDLWVRYRTSYERRLTLKRALLRLGRREHLTREVLAVRGLSFTLPRGSVLGIIGQNGAGKSTLLRTIGGILPPTSGRVTVRGRVSTLLSLGVGFNKELTGRDNVILGGLAAGFRLDEIRERFDEIATFADLGEFIDVPMRAYSAGMFSRLAFAVAVHLEPEILLIDEALSTGDAAFKKKSLEKMRELIAGDCTVVIVSHGLSLIEELADTCLWIERGELRELGEPAFVVAEYMEVKKVARTAAAMEDL